MKTVSFKKFKAELLKDEEVKREYDLLAPEFELVESIIAKRIKKGYTQVELADRAHTTQSAIARLESGRYNPTVAFLQKVSLALGSNLRISFE